MFAEYPDWDVFVINSAIETRSNDGIQPPI